MVPYAKPAASACARSGVGRYPPTANPTTSIGTEGRYGVEDTRRAVREACRRGLGPFCIALDTEADTHLPRRLSSGGFAAIRHPSQPPARLPRLYARLTR